MDNELLLYDRIEVIKSVINKYGEENFYLSFSGGKDSTILHHLLDMAIPENNIQRVFIDTGIEYKAIRDFVLQLAKNDDRFVILKPTQPIKIMLEKYGYPFKSKEHSTKLQMFQNGSKSKSVKKYLSGNMFGCPEMLKYQFSDEFKIKVSAQCCNQMKKHPAKKWAKQNNKSITITGMRKAEGGQRTTLSCILTDKNGKVKKFHPLAVVDDEWEDWFIERYRVQLSILYKEPFNFKRTGCKGCPFSMDLQQQLDIMEIYLPSEKKQCEIIWKPIYEEYRRIGYRLKKNNGQMNLFDFNNKC